MKRGKQCAFPFFRYNGGVSGAFTYIAILTLRIIFLITLQMVQRIPAALQHQRIEGNSVRCRHSV